MSEPLSIAQGMQDFIDSIPTYLRGSDLVHQGCYAAAHKLDAGSAKQAATILWLLDAGADYGTPAFPVNNGLNLPADHLLHLDNGTEWYWFSANLQEVGGETRIGVVFFMTRTRLVSAEIQQQASWTDAQAQLVHDIGTITFADADGAWIAHLPARACWPIGGDTVVFPTKQAFTFQCGDDVIQGQYPDVLPVTVTAGDAGHGFDLTFSSPLAAGEAYFRQFADGTIPEPKPGFYYSWPQLTVSGTVRRVGRTYQVTGTGWIDHELNMRKPPPPPLPLPPVLDDTVTRAFGGWQWTQMNLSNGDAYTAVTLQNGPLSVNPVSHIGIYVERTADGWKRHLVTGAWHLDNYVPTLRDVLQPTSWTMAAKSALGAVDISITPQVWLQDCSFEMANRQIYSEAPMTAVVAAQSLPNGGGPASLSATGYCECVGTEVNVAYARRALAFLGEPVPSPTT